MRIRGRRVALAFAAAVALLLIAGGVYLWHNLVFSGETRPIAGTRHFFVVQPGVTEQDLALVSEGLRLADQFFVARIGHAMDNAIEVRMARTTPCLPFLPLDRSPTAVADRELICVNTVGHAWTKVVPQDRPLGLSIIAHEHFHNWQAQFNCLPGPNDHEYAWWVEGSATYVGLHTTVAAGLMSEDAVRERMRQWGGFSDKLGPLASYEKRISGDAAYALAYRAIVDLVQRGGGEASLYRFCEQVGRGEAWRTAFEDAYGISVENFYTHFEGTRSQKVP
ncbi:MAG TPA: hypothetical protein VFS21_02435 [Roseiflexaceae bacterium]|nr:hypothetical protein [Roseiflexaceae bacterium]